jgi:hypothetical protein
MQHPDVRYEKSDAKVGTILACGIGLAVIGLIVQLAAAWLFDVFQAKMRREDAPLPTLAAQDRVQLPRDLGKIPPPLLQQYEPVDLERLRREEDRQLNGYGWVDEKAGVVHIPIAEVMRLLADPKTADAHGIRVDNAAKQGARR